MSRTLSSLVFLGLFGLPAAHAATPEPAHVAMRCETPGVTLLIDGKALPYGTTAWEGVVSPTAPAVAIRQGSGSEASLPALAPGMISTVACVADGRGTLVLRVTSTRPLVGAGLATSPAAPTAADRACAGAKAGELKTVCEELKTTRAALDALRKAAARAREDAIRRLEELTRGGVADQLR